MSHVFEGQQIEEWQVLDKKVVGHWGDGMLVWMLVVHENYPTGIWAPFITEVDGITVRDWPGWAPLPGSQMRFLTSPVFETLFAGNRGGGKSEALLLDYGKEVGKGYGANWRGILFRQELGDLDEMVRKTETVYKPVFPGFKFLQSKGDYAATWPTGEKLLFRHLLDETEYKEYHGHSTRGDSEVLTPDRGWVALNDIHVGDAIYEVAPDRTLVNSIVETKSVRRHEGELVQVIGRGVFMEFTPEHKLGVLRRAGCKEERSKSWLSHPGDAACIEVVPYVDCFHDEYVARWVRYESSEELQEFVLPEVSFRKTKGTGFNPTVVNGDDWVEFIGWFLSEGCTIAQEGNVYGRIAIAQEKEPQRSNIRFLLDRIGIKYCEQPSEFVFYGPQWYAYCQQFGRCRDKFIPQNLKNLPVRQLKILFSALMAGDGSFQKENAYYFTTSRALADDVAEIAVKLGYAVSVSSRERDNRDGPSFTVACRAHRRDFHLMSDVFCKKQRLDSAKRRTNAKRVQYAGNVVSIGVPIYSSFLIRQKGCVWVSGNSYTWIGFEELTQWPNPKAYLMMFSTCRPTTAGIPTRIRATCNPHGVGHQWVRKRWQLPQMYGKIIRIAGEEPRIAIRSRMSENFPLLHTDPSYKQRVLQSAASAAQAKAWGEGSWEVSEGGVVDDIWAPHYHVVPNVPAQRIPYGWRFSRSYDHGQSKPFSVLWWAESNGEPIHLPDGRWIGQIPGDLLLFNEWYGTSGEEDVGLRMAAGKIAQGIKEREQDMGISRRVVGGVADTEIWSKDSRGTGLAPIDDFEREHVYWDKADKSPGSRVRGWTLLREYMAGSIPNTDGTRDRKGMFVCQRNKYWLEQIPSMPRSMKNPDEIAEGYPDHAADSSRYRLTWVYMNASRRSF